MPYKAAAVQQPATQQLLSADGESVTKHAHIVGSSLELQAQLVRQKAYKPFFFFLKLLQAPSSSKQTRVRAVSEPISCRQLGGRSRRKVHEERK